MIIGAFGELVFEVSARRVVTFDSYKRTTKAKYATHEIIGRPPVLEFTGRELEEITLTITLISCLGVTPEVRR
ncbi:MAG: phage tail protein [Selenomonadaceae bacterium]|nr:phage tail protein [Selenomonadaceae bacterium]